LPEGFKPFVSGNVTFIDIPLNVENSIFEVKKLLYSPYHIYTAILVAEIIKYFDTTIKDNDTWTIGLIAPYKAQAILMNKLITSFGLSPNVKIYADTVHGFQGDECDMVFFVANPNGFGYSGHKKALLSKEYIYNVAVSRARDYLLILHPFDAIRNNPHINSLFNIFSSNFGNSTIRNSAEYEKMLFGELNHIEKSSYLTGHDTINVFGQIDMKYFIKANSSAIDIQLRKLE
jgi:superfamily I DNA and/or RNA helicase